MLHTSAGAEMQIWLKQGYMQCHKVNLTFKLTHKSHQHPSVFMMWRLELAVSAHEIPSLNCLCGGLCGLYKLFIRDGLCGLYKLFKRGGLCGVYKLFKRGGLCGFYKLFKRDGLCSFYKLFKRGDLCGL